MLLRVFLILFLSCSVASADNEQDKWEGYMEFMGKPGTTRSLGVSDLFVPLWQDKNNLSFFNLRGQTESFDDGDFNIGFGHRHQFGKFILGAYGYYDGAESDQGFYYHQWSTGLEFLSENWDFRVNGYIADRTIKEISYNKVDTEDVGIDIEEGKGWVDYSRWEHWEEERASSGFDMEIGYKLPVFEDTRLYLGGYHFAGQHGFEAVTGPRVRVETRLHDLPYLGAGSRLMAGLETQSDDVRGGQTTGMISIRIPFGAVQIKRPVLAKSNKLDRRMLEPVVKNTNIITTEKETTRFRSASTGRFYNPKGLEYTKLIRETPEYNMQEIMDRTQKTIDEEGVLPLVIIDGGIDIEADSVEVIGGATFAFAGESLAVGYLNSFDNKIKKISFTPEGNTPNLVLTGDFDWGLKLADRAHINGWNIDATEYDDGIRLLNAGAKYYITNSTVSNAKENNIRLSHGTLYVNELALDRFVRPWVWPGDTPPATGIYMAQTGKLRGVEGTEGTLGYFAGRSPDVRIDYSILITMANVDSVKGDNIHELDEETAHISGVTIDATHYENGIQATGVDRRYFVTDTIVKNTGKNQTNGAGIASGVAATLYVKNSKVYGKAAGFFISNGALLVADNIEAFNNNIGIFVGDEGSLTLTNSLLYGNVIGLSVQGKALSITESKFFDNGKFGIQIIAAENFVMTHSEVYNNNLLPPADGLYLDAGAGIAVYGAQYVKITDTIIRDNNGGPGLFVDTDSGWGDDPSKVYLERVTITGQPDAVISRGESLVDIKDSNLSGNCSKVVDYNSSSEDDFRASGSHEGTIFGTITVDGVNIDNGSCP